MLQNALAGLMNERWSCDMQDILHPPSLGRGLSNPKNFKIKADRDRIIF